MFTKMAILHNVPFEDSRYVERKDKNSCNFFQVIRNKLNENPVVVVTQDKTVTGPTGKSALAAQYVRKKAYTAYKNIIWLDASNVQTYQKSLKEVDFSHGEEVFKKYLLDGECLLIIDNIDDKKIAEELLSHVKKGVNNELILITKNESLFSEENKIYLSKFSVEDSLELGIKMLGKHFDHNDKNYFHLLMEFINYDVFKLRKILVGCSESVITLKSFFNGSLKTGILRLPKFLQLRKGINNIETLSGKDYANFSEEFWKHDEALLFKVAVDFMSYIDRQKLAYSYVSCHFDNLIEGMLNEFTVKLNVY